MYIADNLPHSLHSRLWLDSASLQAPERNAAENCALLWLHLADGRVLAFGLPHAQSGNDALIPLLINAIAGDMRGTLLEIPLHDFGVAIPLYNVPAAPIPALPWGHPGQEAARYFAAGLDQPILALLARLNTHRVWTSARNYSRIASLPSILRLHRMQALSRFPVLVAPILLTAHHYHDYGGGKRHAWRAHDDTVIGAIDHGRDLAGALAAHYSISKSLVRAPVCKNMWGDTGLAHTRLLQLIDGIPAQQRPASADELTACAQPLVWLNSIGGEHANWKQLGQSTFKTGLANVWQTAERHFPDLQHALADTRDFLRATLAENPGEREHDEHTLALEWLETRGLLHLLRASRQWHQLAPARASATSIGLQLSSILGTHEQDGYRASEILDYPSLAAEGQAMHHCVASYWNDCVERGTRIFSLTAENGERATAEFVRMSHPGEKPRYRLAQLRGRFNAHASTALREFALRLENAINIPITLATMPATTPTAGKRLSRNEKRENKRNEYRRAAFLKYVAQRNAACLSSIQSARAAKTVQDNTACLAPIRPAREPEAIQGKAARTANFIIFAIAAVAILILMISPAALFWILIVTAAIWMLGLIFQHPKLFFAMLGLGLLFGDGEF